MYTRAIEDYLKAIYEIQQEHGKVATSTLAERLGVAPASVTGMIKKLADLRLVDHQPYRGVVLTDTGLKSALEVIRHHRLVELFLAKTLGVPWDLVHEEAHRIEHVLSEYLEDQMDVTLGYPTTDPHGAPIPARDGTIEQPDSVPLARLQPGQSAVVVEVSDHQPAFLRHLDDLGLRPKVRVCVIATAPFDGPMTVRIGNTEHALGREVMNNVLVTEVNASQRVGSRE